MKWFERWAEMRAGWRARPSWVTRAVSGPGSLTQTREGPKPVATRQRGTEVPRRYFGSLLPPRPTSAHFVSINSILRPFWRAHRLHLDGQEPRSKVSSRSLFFLLPRFAPCGPSLAFLGSLSRSPSLVDHVHPLSSPFVFSPFPPPHRS